MATAVTITEVAQLAAQLTVHERLKLVETIVHDLAAGSTVAVSVRGRAWREIHGCVESPLFGADAQDWITRSRQEGDEARRVE